MGSGLLIALKDPLLFGVEGKVFERVSGVIENFWEQNSNYNGEKIPWIYVKLKDQEVYLALIGQNHKLENGKNIVAEGPIQKFENPPSRVIKTTRYYTKKPGFLFGRNLKKDLERYFPNI